MKGEEKAATDDKEENHTVVDEATVEGKSNGDLSPGSTQPADSEVSSKEADREERKQVNGLEEKSTDDQKATQGNTLSESSNGANAEMQSVDDSKVAGNGTVPTGSPPESTPTAEQDTSDSSLKEATEQGSTEVETVKEAVATEDSVTAESLESGTDSKEQQSADKHEDQTEKNLPDVINGSGGDGEASKSVPGNSGTDASTTDSQPQTSSAGVSNATEVEANGTVS